MSITEPDSRQSRPAEKTGLIRYFARNPVAANLLMLVFIAGGVASAIKLAIQHYPELSIRAVSVTVRAPGSSSLEVEKDINRRVEETVIGLRGVERIISTATEGLGRVQVELTTFADASTALTDVQNAVDSIENFPPATAETPEVSLWRLSLEVISLAVSSSLAGEDELRRVAEDVRSELLELPSISQVRLAGTRDREISIELSEEELRRLNLSLSEVASMVRRASVNLTFGELRTDSGGVVLHTVAKRSIGEEFKSIPLITRLDGTIVTLGEVAQIRDAFVDREVIARVNGEPTVFVRVDAMEQQSLTRMSEEIRRWLATYEPPGDFSVTVWNDTAEPILARFSGIVRNGIAGMLLVFILLVLVFDLRAAVWITVGIPFSFVGSLIFFGPADLTLNLGTLIAFFLMIGLVVDDALVVGESIDAERDSAKSAKEAAVAGARAVVGPITIGACTTILAFVPFLFVTAGGYQLVNVFPYVALFVLSVSLIESLFILPAHLGHARRWSLWPLNALQDHASRLLDAIRERTVLPAVSWSVRHTGKTLACGAASVLFALLLIRFGAVRIIVLDEQVDVPSYVQVDLHLPVGAPIESTVAVAEHAAAAASLINDQVPGESISAISIVVGNLVSSRSAEAESVGSHVAFVRAHLNERPVRQARPVEIERAWRRNIGDVSHLERIEFQSSRIRTRPSLSYSLRHDDDEVRRSAASEMTAFLANMPGVYEVSDSLALGKRHLEIGLTPAGEAAGLTPASIGMQLRANFHGVEVQRIQRGHEELRVMVRYPPDRRSSLRDLATERLRRVGGGEVPLSTVATLTETRELATLTRIDGRPAALVSARTDNSVTTPIAARREIGRELVPDLLAKHPGLHIEAEAGVRDERELLETMGLLVPVVLIAMYALMAAFLRSYWKPLVAVAGFPIAFAGAVLGHWVLGWDLTGMSLLGILAVFGVIVNDSLVLLDRYNTIRQSSANIPAIAAAAAATRHRFRAVFLTSATTVLGLSPLLYERSDDLMFLVPFVVSIIGGVILTGVFILFILPALVMIAEGSSD